MINPADANASPPESADADRFELSRFDMTPESIRYANQNETAIRRFAGVTMTTLCMWVMALSTVPIKQRLHDQKIAAITHEASRVDAIRRQCKSLGDAIATRTAALNQLRVQRQTDRQRGQAMLLTLGTLGQISNQSDGAPDRLTVHAERHGYFETRFAIDPDSLHDDDYLDWIETLRNADGQVDEVIRSPSNRSIRLRGITGKFSFETVARHP